MIKKVPVLDALSHLFFPHICNGCGSDLLAKKNLLCLKCLQALPFTGYEKISDNPVEKIFTGRVPLESAFSLLYFTKNSLMQHLLHQLKYKGNLNLGIYLGELMGEKIKASGSQVSFDFLVPVPLHVAKQKKRGYNQSALLCQGIQKILNTSVSADNLYRSENSSTQTKKSRAQRWENTKDIFELKNTSLFENKHILLVDDVLTTGATLESCVNTLQKSYGCKVSIAALALAVEE